MGHIAGPPGLQVDPKEVAIVQCRTGLFRWGNSVAIILGIGYLLQEVCDTLGCIDGRVAAAHV